MHNKELVKKWIINGIDSETIENARMWGEMLAKPNGREKDSEALTNSQIRVVFGEMKRIQLNGYEKEKTSFLLLKPKLAYAVKRHGKKGINLFNNLFVDAYNAIDKTNDKNGEKQFHNLMNIMEAVLAYHKYYGGKE